MALTSSGSTGDEGSKGDGYVAAVDVGSSNLRCHIYDAQARVRGSATNEIKMLCPSVGRFEINPEHLWQTFVATVKSALDDASLPPESLSAIGISTQRGTFTTWDRCTGKVYHEFISWKDTRAEKLCQEWNQSFRMRALRGGSKVLHCITRNVYLKALSSIWFSPAMISMKLLWVLQNVPQLKEAVARGNAMLGTVDTFLLWKLTGGTVHATDPSNACATGLFDPFTVKWSEKLAKLLGTPTSVLPQVLNTSGIFGETDPNIFGVAIPIACLVGDQQASAFGECCFETGDIKCTMGTGTFFNVNTGSKPHGSTVGVYPVIGWQIHDVVTYFAEVSSYDTGTVISWAEKLGLLKDAKESSDLATSVEGSEGVFFVPAFSGLQVPVNDAYAGSGFLGISANTRKAQMVRAILESLAFRAKQVYQVLVSQVSFPQGCTRFNGGVTNNDFVMQLMADVLEEPIVLSGYRDASSLGAAFLAGLAVGIWKDKDVLKELREEGTTLEPCLERSLAYKPVFAEWQRAVDRFLLWHCERSS